MLYASFSLHKTLPSMPDRFKNTFSGPACCCLASALFSLNCAVLLFAVLVTWYWSPVSKTCFMVFLCKGSGCFPHGLSLVGHV